MKRIDLLLIGVLASLACLPNQSFAALPSAAAPESYQVILVRNAFGLKEPPPPPPPPPPPEPPATNIKLTGFATLRGIKKVLLMTQEGNTSEYHSLAEKERIGGLEVLEINEKAGTAKIRNAGVPLVLTFDTHGVKVAAAPAPPAPGALPGGMIPGRPMPGIPQPAGGGAPGQRPTAPGMPHPPSATGDALRSIPTRSIRTPTGGTGMEMKMGGTPNQTHVVPTPHSNLSLEESIILLEANRAINQPAIDRGQYPPLPPTPFSQD
jgi:hypothetical protein